MLILSVVLVGFGCTSPRQSRAGGDGGGAVGGGGGAAAGAAGAAADAGGDEAGGGQDPGGQDAGGQDAGGQDAGGQDAGGQDQGGQDQGGQDAGGQDAGGQDAAGQDEGGQDQGGQDEGGQEEGGDEEGGTDEGGQDEGGGDEGGGGCEEAGGCEPVLNHCDCQWQCHRADDGPIDDCDRACPFEVEAARPECTCDNGECHLGDGADACEQIGGCEPFFTSCTCDWTCVPAGDPDRVDCDRACPPDVRLPPPDCGCDNGECFAHDSPDPDPDPQPEGFCVQISHPDVQPIGIGQECELIDFACEEGHRGYFDACSCGCIRDDGATFACEDDADCVAEDCCRPTGCVARAAVDPQGCDDDERNLCCFCEDCRPTVQACGCVAGLCRTAYDADGCG